MSGVGLRPSLDAGLLRGRHVLVIDDDDDARELLHAVLEYCGALTAYAFAHASEAALAAGFNAYLKKPVEPWQLCRTIDALCRSSSA